MPNIAEFKQIIKHTPIDQALMLIGIHGVGKSEIIKQMFEEQGYGVITLFLGQNDVGDIVGLPDRTEVEFTYGGKKMMKKITEFCPPKWWPRDDKAKMIVFLDEFNRGKPEVYQCIFDMVLNRKLNGLPLPEETRIIVAMNPSGDDYNYDVIDLDPALWDRFNVYNFKPSSEEWIDYAIKSKHHKLVIGFINKHKEFLDPPSRFKNGNATGGSSSNLDLQVSSDNIYPSRRSWTRVSKILQHTIGIEKNEELLTTMLMGIVGTGATGAFRHYIKESTKNITAGKIVTGWDNDVSVAVRLLNNVEVTSLNKEIAIYLSENENVLFDASSAKEAGKYATNVGYYLKAINIEIAANFIDLLMAANKERCKWPDKLMRLNGNMIANLLHDVTVGKSEHDKKVAQMVNEDKESQESSYKESEDFGDTKKPDDDEDGFDDISSEIDDLTK